MILGFSITSNSKIYLKNCYRNKDIFRLSEKRGKLSWADVTEYPANYA